MRDWLMFFFGVLSLSGMVVLGAGTQALPPAHHGLFIAGIALISEAAVLCISAQNHIWRMFRALILFFYWPLFFLLTLDARPVSWLDATPSDTTQTIIVITLASVVGIVIGLFWYLVTLAHSTAPRTVIVRGQRYIIREDAHGPYLELLTYEQQYP